MCNEVGRCDAALEGVRLAVRVKGQGRQREDGEVGTEGVAVDEREDLADDVEHPEDDCPVAVVDVAMLDKVVGEREVVDGHLAMRVGVKADDGHEPLPQREFIEHIADVYCACLTVFHLAEHETLCTVKYLGMTGRHFHSTVQPSGALSGLSSSTRLSPRTPPRR